MYVDFDDSEDFIQTLKITAVKKLVWNEVIFVEDDAELEKLSQLITKAFFQNELLERDESVTVGKACHNINMIEDHSETAETIFNTLADVSKQTGLGFIINFSSQTDFLGSGLMIPFGDLHFHPELIMNGRRLIADLPDINLNRFCFCLHNQFLVDCSRKDRTLANEVLAHREGLDYWTKFSDAELLEKGLVTFSQVEKSICAEMLDSLNKYFQVDYSVDVVYGLTKQDYEGLCDEVRKQIVERFYTAP